MEIERSTSSLAAVVSDISKVTGILADVWEANQNDGLLATDSFAYGVVTLNAGLVVNVAAGKGWINGVAVAWAATTFTMTENNAVWLLQYTLTTGFNEVSGTSASANSLPLYSMTTDDPITGITNRRIFV